MTFAIFGTTVKIEITNIDKLRMVKVFVNGAIGDTKIAAEVFVTEGSNVPVEIRLTTKKGQ